MTQSELSIPPSTIAMSLNNDAQDCHNEDEDMENQEDDDNEEDLIFANQPSMRSLSLVHTTNDGIAFIVNLEQGMLLEFDPIMGSFGIVLEKGCSMPIADIQPMTPLHMAQAAVKILALQENCPKRHADEDGMERIPKNVLLVLVSKANTATASLFLAFTLQFRKLMINHASDKEQNRHVQCVLANMKTSQSCLRQCVSPDAPKGG